MKTGPILVTGSAGFLGSALCKAFIERGHDVVGVDRIEGDLTDAFQVRTILEEHRPSTIIHCAAQVGRQFCEDNFDLAISSNVTATVNVASAARNIGADLVHFSTSEVYGDRNSETCKEFDPLNATPTGMYALTKRWSEDVVNAYGPQAAKILRPSMPYGPGAPPGRGRRALDNMLWQAHHGMPIPVHIGAERSWCYLSDFIDAVVLITLQGSAGPYNVGRDDDPRSMLEVARISCDIAGASYDLIEYIDPPQRQTVVKRLSTARVNSLGWKPRVSLEDGMANVYEWIKRFDSEGNYIDPDPKALESNV